MDPTPDPTPLLTPTPVPTPIEVILVQLNGDALTVFREIEALLFIGLGFIVLLLALNAVVVAWKR